MSEKLKPESIAGAKKLSRRIERAWRIFTHPKDYSMDQVRDAGAELIEHKNQLWTSIQLDPDGPNAEIYSEVMLGVFHYPDFTFPPELKYKAHKN